jgi:hypothetical protein
MRGQRNWGTVNVVQLQQDLFGARQGSRQRNWGTLNVTGELSTWYNKTCSARGKDPDLVRRSDKNFIVDRSMNVKSTFH